MAINFVTLYLCCVTGMKILFSYLVSTSLCVVTHEYCRQISMQINNIAYILLVKFEDAWEINRHFARLTHDLLFVYIFLFKTTGDIYLVMGQLLYHHLSFLLMFVNDLTK